MDLSGVFHPAALGEERLAKLGVQASQAAEPGFSLLKSLGFTSDQIDQATEHV